MRKYKIGLFVGTILLGLSLVGCSKKISKNPNTVTGPVTAPQEDLVTISFDTDGGNNISSLTTRRGDWLRKPPADPTKEGYTFKYWTYEGSKWDFSIMTIAHNMTVVAYWQPNSYALTLTKNITEAGTVTGSGTFECTSEVTITAQSNDGYEFDGWYYNNQRVCEEETYTFNMFTKDSELEARWNRLKYAVTKTNWEVSDEVEIEKTPKPEGFISEYEIGTTITFTATSIPSGKMLEWELRPDGIKQIGGTSFTFVVPAHDVDVWIGYAQPYYKNNDKIFFGYYPQTLEKEEATIESLNSLVGTPENPKEGYTWIDYEYYDDYAISSYMYYIDLDIDKDGRNDYRGVYFSKYRPFYTSYKASESNSYQDNNGYSTSTVYWFEYERIKWSILEEKDGKAMLIADLLLDSQNFEPSTSNSTYTHSNGESGYASNYELSYIRRWLNDNFYNTAFLSYENAIIQKTFVDNSSETTNTQPNHYTGNDTEDKVFLLSYKDISTYYPDDSERKASGTDYAKIQGLKVNSEGCSNWWLRSPALATIACSVKDNGEFYYNDSVVKTTDGIRPVLVIEL